MKNKNYVWWWGGFACLLVLFSFVTYNYYWSGNTGRSVAARTPSQAGGDCAADITAVNEKILALQDVKKVDALVGEIQAALSKNPSCEGLKLYNAVSSLLPTFKNYIWRTLQLKFPVTSYTDVILAADFRKARKNLYRVGPHFTPLFDYILHTDGAEAIPQQEHYSDFQKFYTQELSHKLDSTIFQLTNLVSPYMNNDGLNHEILLLDTSIIFGKEKWSALIDSKYKNMRVTVEHINILLSHLHRTQAALSYLASYNLDGFRDLLKHTQGSFRGHFVSEFATDGNFNKIPRNYDFYKTIHNQKYKDLLTLNNYGQKFLPKSLAHIQKATEHRIWAFKGIQLQKDFGEYDFINIINPNNYLSKITVSETNLLKRELIFNSKEPVTFNDPYYSRSFQMNLAALFDPNNEKIRDLKNLMPDVNNFPKDSEKGWIGKNVWDRLTKKRRFEVHQETWVKAFNNDDAISVPDYGLGGLFPEAKTLGDLQDIKGSLGRSNVFPILNVWLDYFI